MKQFHSKLLAYFIRCATLEKKQRKKHNHYNFLFYIHNQYYQFLPQLNEKRIGYAAVVVKETKIQELANALVHKTVKKLTPVVSDFQHVKNQKFHCMISVLEEKPTVELCQNLVSQCSSSCAIFLPSLFLNEMKTILQELHCSFRSDQPITLDTHYYNYTKVHDFIRYRLRKPLTLHDFSFLSDWCYVYVTGIRPTCSPKKRTIPLA